jgi:hypothetical protein
MFTLTRTIAAAAAGITVAITGGGADVAFAATTATTQSAMTTFVGHCAIVGVTESHNSSSTFAGSGKCAGSLNGAATRSYRIRSLVSESGVYTPAAANVRPINGLTDGTVIVRFLGTEHALRLRIVELGLAFDVEGLRGGHGVGLVVPNPTSGTDEVLVDAPSALSS